MKLYDFSAYAERRDALRNERAAQLAVREAIAHIEEPGAVAQLKNCVDDWFALHREVQKVANLH
jgi:hypothetical protein